MHIESAVYSLSTSQYLRSKVTEQVSHSSDCIESSQVFTETRTFSVQTMQFFKQIIFSALVFGTAILGAPTAKVELVQRDHYCYATYGPGQVRDAEYANDRG